MLKNGFKNPYAILKVARNSSDREIQTEYYRAMREAHPDRGGEQEQAADINAAYSAIKNQTVRGHLSEACELRGMQLCGACGGSGGRWVRMRKHKTMKVCETCEGLGYV